MKRTLSLRTITLSGVVVAFAAACGVQNESGSSSQSLKSDLEMARQLVVKCDSRSSAEDQLALELSKTCRDQNAALKAKGFASCAEDFCSDVVSLSLAEKGLQGVTLEAAGDAGGIEFLVTVDSNLALAKKEKNALICYAPVLKAQELLNSLSTRCN